LAWIEKRQRQHGVAHKVYWRDPRGRSALARSPAPPTRSGSPARSSIARQLRRSRRRQHHTRCDGEPLPGHRRRSPDDRGQVRIPWAPVPVRRDRAAGHQDHHQGRRPLAVRRSPKEPEGHRDDRGRRPAGASGARGLRGRGPYRTQPGPWRHDRSRASTRGSVPDRGRGRRDRRRST
jgi:hypothetical protein